MICGNGGDIDEWSGMSVLVRFDGKVAILRAGAWVSADGRLERRLNEYMSRWFQETGGPPLRQKDQEYAVATEMARHFSGQIGLRVRNASRVSNRLFLKKRQMTLDFSAPPLTVTGRGRIKGARSKRGPAA
jgi:hypothetical protein